MTGRTTFTYVDYSGEQSVSQFYNPDLDALNVDTYTDTAISNNLGALKLAIDALTLLNEVQISVGATQILSPSTLPADPNAQREQKLLVKFSDTVTNKKYSFTIPGINRTLVAQVGTDVVDFTSNLLMIALVSAFEAGYVSELGNPVAVYGASLVGRNN